MYAEISANKRKSWLIMGLFVLVVAALALVLVTLLHGNYFITVAVIAGSLVYAALTYFSGSNLALALNGATQIQQTDNPRLWRIVENLAITDGLPMPKVYIIEDAAPNAFATGRNPQNAAVCATTGLLDIMNDTELEGVFAHELSHVKNYDIRVSMIAFALTAIISLIADTIIQFTWFDDRESNNSNQFWIIGVGIIAAILAPIVAMMIQLAISRRREYLADATGALTTRYPEGLASALEKIGQYGRPMRRQNTATAHLFFANPLKQGNIAGLFSTHPPIGDRIARLRNMVNNG